MVDLRKDYYKNGILKPELNRNNEFKGAKVEGKEAYKKIYPEKEQTKSH